jgi:hypothetical protein
VYTATLLLCWDSSDFDHFTAFLRVVSRFSVSPEPEVVRFGIRKHIFNENKKDLKFRFFLIFAEMCI